MGSTSWHGHSDSEINGQSAIKPTTSTTSVAQKKQAATSKAIGGISKGAAGAGKVAGEIAGAL